MGLYKRCSCETKRKNSCEHDWWGQFMHNGTNTRTNLVSWSSSTLTGRQQADAVFARMTTAIRSRTFRAEGERSSITETDVTLSVPDVAERYIKSHIVGNKIKGDEDCKVRRFAAYFATRSFASLDISNLEDYREHLRAPRALTGKAPNGTVTKRKRATATGEPTVNRHLSRLSHLFNWAVSRRLIAASPFTLGEERLIEMGDESGSRHRRLSTATDEEGRLIEHATPELRRLIVIALDTGMRQGEMLALRVADLDARPGWIRIRAEHAKSGKQRYVPVATERLCYLLSCLRHDAAGQELPTTAHVCHYGDGERIGFPEFHWRHAKKRGGISDLRWHDLRHEYASRLAINLKRPLPEVQALLGHANVQTTMRYVNVMDANLSDAVAGLEGFSRSVSTDLAHRPAGAPAKPRLMGRDAQAEA